MKITLNKTNNLITSPLKIYIQQKLMTLAKFVKHFEKMGEVEVQLEISRTSKHHKKGEVFVAAADVCLPGKVLRAEAYATDIRKAIDGMKDTLRMEIEKYKDKALAPKRVRRGEKA